MDGGGRRRGAGVVLPVFSLRSRSDWGVGEIPDVAAFSAWLRAAGQRSLHTLPLLERPPGERSPYSALSAFAIDPIHIGLDALEDFVAAGGRAALTDDEREAITRLRADPVIAYDDVRALKRRALERAFAVFEEVMDRGSSRAGAFERFRHAERDWLGDYALFRALREEHGGASWTAWPAALAARDAPALADAGDRAARAVRFHEYVQWVAYTQWGAARRAAHACGVSIVGDLPFTVGTDSSDVWVRQREFDYDVSIGAPPDAFNADGQDWALPAFRWDVIRAGDFDWLRARLRHAARWLDGVRLDHIVGYFRTYVRRRERPPEFVPADEAAQRALGEIQLDIARAAASSLAVIAEDLGDVPDFVRATMAERSLPGYRVLRWETDGPVFRDPATFPAGSVATTGTHDTSTLATWWCTELGDDARARLADVAAFAGLRGLGPELTPAVHDALIDGLYAARSDTALVLFQDVYGGRERINTPATVGPDNWGYRMRWLVEELAGAAGRERAAWLRAFAVRHGRVG